MGSMRINELFVVARVECAACRKAWEMRAIPDALYCPQCGGVVEAGESVVRERSHWITTDLIDE
jgi:predicted RNA-binding Zn-ribbon protein involved in translation (DUF1610 family)